MSLTLFEAANGFNFLPESLDILIFGLIMILSAVALRRILNRNDKQRTANENFERTTEKSLTSREISRNLRTRREQQVQR